MENLSISISAGAMATAVAAAGMAAVTVVVIMMVAGNRGVMPESARHISGSLFVGAARGACNQGDSRIFQGGFGAFADTAADQHIHAAFTQKAGQCSMAGTAGA